MIKKTGGFKKAFSVEQKCRYLVETILHFAIKDEDELELDSEINLKFQGKRIKPDLIIF